MKTGSIARCEWAGTDPLMVQYHDQEWGVPLHDDQRLFEFLLLEGAQAGLSWSTILKKRQGYRRAFEGFDVQAVAAYDEQRMESLLQDESIVRNRLKIQAAVMNARATLQVQQEFGSFDRYVWSFTGGRPIQSRRVSLTEIPAETAESRAMSRDLKERGFKFVGPTICYAFMQAVGLVNDHTVACFRYRELL